MSTIEKITRKEWLERNPIVHRWVEENQIGWTSIPAFTVWPDANEIEGITDHQKEQLSLSLAGRIGILGGSPGTGKSYTVAKLIQHMMDSGTVGAHEICVGAPTGKAAVRVTELLQKAGIPIRARTWHSILGIGANSETGGWSFMHNENNHLPARVLIGDESSMIDLSLMLSIFQARAPGTHILLVGDVNQLPPVGAGAPMRDMILARIPSGELKEIKRNSGGIVEACAAIRDEKPWQKFTEGEETNLKFHHRADADEQIEACLELIRTAQANGLDPVWDCQILVAVNEKSDLSRQKVNQILQEELNFDSPKVNGTSFRNRDKIVCLKNGWYQSLAGINADVQSNDRGEVFIANGELAEVVDVDGGKLIVELDLPARKVAIPFRANTDSEDGNSGAGALANWDLGYALSVHKSQGSEWPEVMILLDKYPGARQICDRAWLYTAISRAKSKCHLIGQFDLAERFVRVQKISQRKTFLREQIGLQMFERSGI